MGARGRCLVVCVGLAAVSCGGSSSSTSTLDAAAFAQRYCALFAPCCTDVGVTQGNGCRTLISRQTSLVGKVGVLGEQCLTELNAKFEGFGYCNFFESSTPSCDGVLGQSSIPPSGSVPPGGDCTQDSFSCAPSARGHVSCTFDLSTTEFVLRCQEEIPGGAAGNGPCVGTVTEDGALTSSGTIFVASGYTCAVADGVYCDSTANVCAPVRQPGEACSAVDPAACPTNFCVNDICTARAALGAPCTSDEICSPTDCRLCVQNAYCDTSATCARGKPPGAACQGLSHECEAGDCQNGVCTPPWTASSLGYLCDP